MRAVYFSSRAQEEHQANHPDGVQIFDWRAHRTYPFLIVPVISPDLTQVDERYFFCTMCKRWYRLSGTIGNLNSHIRRKHNNLVTQDQNMSEQERTSMFTKFVLTTGLPFRTVEHPIIRKLFPSIGSRKDLAVKCSHVANEIRRKIGHELANAMIITISADEWTDGALNRYLGIQVYSTSASAYKVLTIALVPITELHATAIVLGDIIKVKLEEYNITDRVQRLITDTTAVMPAVSEYIGIKWSPCYCHIANLILQKFISAISDKFRSITDLQKKLSHSTIFRTFCRQHNSNRTTIPNFTPTRWYSAYEMVRAMYELKDIINEFLSQNNQIIPENFWEMLFQLGTILKTFKEITLNLESNKYGTLSLVISNFRYLAFQAEQLCQHSQWEDPHMAFSEAMATHWQQYYETNRMELILAARLNPALKAISLTNEEVNDADQYIRSQLSRATIPVHSATPITRNIGITFSEWQRMNAPSTAGNSTDELVTYLNMSTLIDQDPIDFDLFEFWKQNKGRMPTLYEIATKIYGTPASSAASERAFSKA